jgi:hypothetical protein
MGENVLHILFSLFTTRSRYTGPTSPPPFPGWPVWEATDDLFNFPLLPIAQKFQKSATAHPEYFLLIINRLSRWLYYAYFQQ